MRNATNYDRSFTAILYHTAIARIFLCVLPLVLGGECALGVVRDKWDVALTLCIESLNARDMQLVLVLHWI